MKLYVLLGVSILVLFAGVVSAWPRQGSVMTMDGARKALGLAAPRPPVVAKAPPKLPLGEEEQPAAAADEDEAVAAPEDWLNRPRRLKRAEIEAGMERVEPSVIQCKHLEEASGTVTVRLEVGASGSVQSVVVLPPFADTKTGQCVARAVRGASFPSFAPVPTPTLTIVYPYYFQAPE